MKSYRQFIFTLALLLLAIPAFSQVQKGYVRTCGRPNNPKGTRISGITIRVAGLHSPVVSQNNGYFDFDLGGGQSAYSVTSVRDNSYQYELQEKELLNRKEPVSAAVPKEIVMVSLAEKRAIEEKKRQQIESKYQQDIDRLEAQKAHDEITIEQYRQQLQELQDAFDKRDMLITDLSEHFASIDYAMLSDEQARISALLEDGDLLTADSIINAKGDFTERLNKYFAFADEYDKMDNALQQRRSDEAAGLEDLKKDCESKFLICQQQHKLDTAKYYLEMLVSLDTNDVESLVSAGEFFMEYLALYDEAFAYYQRALRISIEKNGENCQQAGNCYNNLAYIYNLKSKQEEALAYYDKSLAIAMDLFGENSKDVAYCYNNIGIVYDDRGDNVTALKYYEKSLEIRKEIFGDNHLKVAIGYNNIGYIYQKQGNYDKAIEYFQRALEIRLASLGETHQLVATSYNNLGSQYFYLGDYAKATDYYKKSLGIRKIVFGDKHPDVATSYNNIGALYYYQDSLAKAAEYYEKSLKINIDLLGEEVPDVATNYNNIGVLYYRQKEYAKALENYEKALEIRQTIFPENHPDIANSYFNLGNLFFAQDSLAKAMAYHQKALKMIEISLGPNHPDVATPCLFIGRNYNKQGDPVNALEYFIRAYDVALLSRGKESKSVQRLEDEIEGLYEKVKGNSDKASKMVVKRYMKWKKQNK